MGSKSNNWEKVIVLNRMYVGDYLSTNIGHEVINMFKADNGEHYLYLNSRGNLTNEHKGKIDFMLFVKYYTEGVVEVIGKAVGLEEADGVFYSQSRKLGEEDSKLSEAQKQYIEKQKDGVFYNGAPILKIFEGSGQQNIYITYKAKYVFRTNKEKRILIGFSGVNEDDEDIIKLDAYKQAKASLKQYIYPGAEYEKLMNIINDDSNWEKSPVGKVTDEIEKLGDNLKIKRDISLFDICQIQNDENRFSNALAYFMMQDNYRNLWQFFFKQYNIDLDKGYTVSREEKANIEDKDSNHKIKSHGGRIDLLIRDKNNIIVIENKIKSDINSVKGDGDGEQLERYYNYICWRITNEGNPDKGKKKHFFILTPKYNQPNIKSEKMKKEFRSITYRDLYNFLQITSAVKEDHNFKAFFDAMHRHTHDNVNDYLYYEMLEKFVRRINEVKMEK